MRTSDLIKSKYFAARDVLGQPPLFLKIAHVSEELVGRGHDQEMKSFLWFINHEKGLQLNKTRIKVLEAAYGPETDLWTGKRVKLGFDPTVKFGAVEVGSITVEVPPGTVYRPPVAGAWGAPAGAPTPVLNPKTGLWELPPAAPVTAAAVAPVPVLNPHTGLWELPVAASAPAPRPAPTPMQNPVTGVWEIADPQTGEMRPIAGQAAPKPVNPQDGTWGGAPTMSERMAAPVSDSWEQASTGVEHADFNDDIPF